MTNDYRSVRFHLSYPRQASVLSWEECACLARSLGYRDNSLEQCYRQAIDAKYATEGFQLSQLDAFVGSKFFKSGFDFSFNSHWCEWNEQVVRRAVAVTAGKGMTFQQLYTTRIAYGLYESSDLRGLKAKPRTVMRALKACGRAISLGKMAHRVRHMKFHEPGRLQLDEFIDLALWAGPLDREEARCTLRPAEGRHEMVSFEEMLTPMDTRIQRRLDSEYRQDERQYVRETVRPAETRLRQCAVQAYRDKRLERSRQARTSFETLRRALRESASGAGARSSRATLRAASAAAAGRRESAYWTDSTDNEDELGTGNEEHADSRCANETDVQETVSFSSKSMSCAKQRPATSCSLIRSTPALVTDSDLSQTELLRDALAFQTEALPELHSRQIAENMQTLRPGFEQRHAKRLAEASATAEEQRKAAEAQRRAARASAARQARQDRRQQRLDRMAELAIRQEPEQLPSHSRACDATDRSAASKGGRLTAAHYEASYQGRLLQQLSEADARQVRRVRGQRVGSSVGVRIGQPQRKPRPETAPASPVKKPIVDDENEEQWLEPRLGLVLPLRGPACRLSRLSYSRSCPPREHPVGAWQNLTTTNTSDEELASTVDLIQRVFYAKA
ncbi:hypothetical protein BOX15_Mlig012851g3 [Macrostomum lignano]|uniref:Uncharacterized protein n=1 Tax=Macrostomum lignano TaxID=282301 RepID=A0A267DKV1_9PLAT|nr:hypothetical protein BOX15_Mlig012851g3 [Macrostomum lignano]